MTRSEESTTYLLDELEQLRARVRELERESAHRLRVEDEHRRADDRYRRLVETVRLIAWEFDPATKRFDFVSQYAPAMLGYPFEAWRETAFWYNHVHPEDRERVLAENIRTNRTGDLFDIEYRLIQSNGQNTWVREEAVLIHAPDDVLGRAGARLGQVISAAGHEAPPAWVGGFAARSSRVGTCSSGLQELRQEV